MDRFSRLLSFVVLGGAILGFTSSCEKPQGFVELSEDSFIIGDSIFFPVMLNYVGQFYGGEDWAFFGPEGYYIDSLRRGKLDHGELKMEAEAELAFIREMGFNSIRLCFDRLYGEGDQIGYPVNDTVLFLEQDYDRIFAGLGDFIDICKANDLKVMILIHSPLDQEPLIAFTNRLLAKFKDEPTIFAYDFFNEPLYNVIGSSYSKAEAAKFSLNWRRMMNQNAPNQLLTIGSSEPTEVFRWDPSVLDVDFISFHTYNPMRVANEIYWYSNYLGKPWMIGETSLAMGEDSISAEMQDRFVVEVTHRVKSCGGLGLGWWEYMDKSDSPFYEARRSGLMIDTGFTITGRGDTLKGTPKLAMHRIKDIPNIQASGTCEKMANYWNMVGYSNYRLDFEVRDSLTQKPIEGAVIRGWDQSFSIGENTFTDENGKASLYSNERVVEFRISAPGKSLKKVYYRFPYAAVTSDVLSEDSLPDKKLGYQQISFLTLLAQPQDSLDGDFNGKYFVFDFKPNLLNQAAYVANAGVILLEDF